MPRERLPENVEFEPQKMLEVLARHDVAFVVVGGIAAIYHASPYATFDLDVCPSDDDANLRRLASALGELDAKMRVTDEPDPVRIDFSPRILRAAPFLNLETRWGPLDVILKPAGADGYEDLNRRAIDVQLGDLTISVASRLDILNSKEILLREKDLPTVRLLRELEERERADQDDAE